VVGLALSLLGAAVAHAETQISVGASPLGRPMPPGFVGVSLEYRAVHAYTGRDPRSVNPVLIQLLRALAPGQSPVLRIGGDSTDQTWWPVPGMIPPGGIGRPSGLAPTLIWVSACATAAPRSERASPTMIPMRAPRRCTRAWLHTV
jgi:hypothetical protein